MKPERRFEQLLQVRAPEALTEALNEAAARRLQSRSSYIRTALVDRLRDEGINLQFNGAAA